MAVRLRALWPDWSVSPAHTHRWSVWLPRVSWENEGGRSQSQISTGTNTPPLDAHVVPILIFNCQCFSFVCLLVFTDCLRCPLLPHEEHCPQRFEGEKAQKMIWAAFRDGGLRLVQDEDISFTDRLHWTESYNLGLVLICVCEKGPLAS